jgi:hypothetical protein
MAHDALDIKESLGALVMRPRAVQRTNAVVDLMPAPLDPAALDGALSAVHTLPTTKEATP